MTKAPASGRDRARRRNGGTKIIVARGESVRTYRLNPWLFGSSLAVLFLFLMAYIAGTGYLMFRDDLLTAAMARQVEIQYDYEDRISLLRSEIDRVTSRHIVETQSIEGQVSSLLERQDGLRRQQVLLDDLVDRARAQGISFASVVVPTPVPRPAVAPAASASESATVSTNDTKPLLSGADKAVPSKDPNTIQPVLKDLRTSLDQFEQLQAMAVHALKVASAREARRLASAMQNFGVKPPQAPVGLIDEKAETAQGGPFIPADTPNLLNSMVTIQQTLQHIDLLKRSSMTIPIHKPVPIMKVTSSYGYRVDPFLKKPGFHAGIDLRGAEGSPVMAAGTGKITHAGKKGGYGLMVEISHGGKLKTRYGHLSSINVTPNQIVSAGDIIGQIGSTGRSTGPHLHYETVRNGKTVDPMTFLGSSDF